MSGFEPVVAQAAAAEFGSTALAAEVTPRFWDNFKIR